MYHSKNVNNVLQKKLGMDVVWALHYFMIGGYTGCLTNVICCAREIVFMNNDKKIFKSRLWLLLFVALNWLSAILMWRGVYSLLPALVSTLGSYSFWQKNITVTRGIALINNVLMFTYDIFVLSYMGMIGESLAFLSVLSAMAMAKTKKKIRIGDAHRVFDKKRYHTPISH